MTKLGLCHSYLLMSLVLLVANLQTIEAGITNYLPSATSLNPFNWLNFRRNAALSTENIKRSDNGTNGDKLNSLDGGNKYNVTNLLDLTANNDTHSVDMIFPSGQARIFRNGTVILPLIVQTPSPTSTTTTLSPLSATTITVHFTPGTIKDMFTTKKPNISVDKPANEYHRKFKITKNGKLYDLLNYTTNPNKTNLSHGAANNVNMYAVAYDSHDDRRNQQVNITASDQTKINVTSESDNQNSLGSYFGLRWTNN